MIGNSSIKNNGTIKNHCVLCGASTISFKFTNATRNFYECLTCDLLFVDPCQALSLDQERQRYEEHHNSFDNAGYRIFLSRLCDAMVPKLSVGMRGLDFGSGASDAMCRLFIEKGYLIERYDPFFAPNELRGKKFDFIVCSEVVEHFRDPFIQFDFIRSLLTPEGIVGVMTQLRDSHQLDAQWWYLRDRTHLCFYSKKTFDWLANKFAFMAEFPSKEVILLESIQ